MCSLFVRSLLRVELTLKLRRTRTDISVAVGSMGFSPTERRWRKPMQASWAGKPAHHTSLAENVARWNF